jgi:four helix bundle protein
MEDVNTKSQASNPKQYQSTNTKISKHYDLEERTLAFARLINQFVNNLPKSIPNIENGKQLVRSASSVGANYIEANEALSKKDFILRIKISRKEAKETRYWLSLITSLDQDSQQYLINETTELIKILSSILIKSSKANL